MKENEARPLPALDFIGDIHGNHDKLTTLLGRLGYERSNGTHGRLRRRERKSPLASESTAAACTVVPPALGFHAAFTHSTVDVHECPVLAPELRDRLHEITGAPVRTSRRARSAGERSSYSPRLRFIVRSGAVSVRP